MTATRRKGGKPVYTEATAAKRAESKIALYLSPAARAELDARAAETEESRSSLVSTAILSTVGEKFFSPAILERAEELATLRGVPVWLVIDEALDYGLDALLGSIKDAG